MLDCISFLFFGWRKKRWTLLLFGLFQLAFFQFLLAFNAVARPRHGFQPLGIDFIAAIHTLAKLAFPDTLKGSLDHRQKLAIIVALGKEKFLGIRTGCAVSNILRRVLIGNTSILFRPAHGFAQR